MIQSVPTTIMTKSIVEKRRRIKISR